LKDRELAALSETRRPEDTALSQAHTAALHLAKVFDNTPVKDFRGMAVVLLDEQASLQIQDNAGQAQLCRLLLTQ
jgi:hypothetical protein